MKNLKLLLLLLTIILSSCSKDETGIPIPEKIKTNPHFWGVKIPDNENSTKGVAQKDRLWYNGTTIKVKFLNDPHGLAETVKQYAA